MTKPIESLSGDDLITFREALRPTLNWILNDEGFKSADHIDEIVAGVEAELDAKVAAAHNWADGTAPGGPGTKSAKDWAADSAASSSRAVNAIPFATWAALATATGMQAGDRARVRASDTGNHTDPVVDGIVANAGDYVYSSAPAGWQRTGDLDSQTANQYANDAAASAALSGIAAKTLIGWLDPVEYEACGLPWAIVDGDFRILASASMTAPQAYFTATGLYWSGQAITALDAVEYEACGYANPIVDGDYRLLSGTSIYVATASTLPVVATALTWGGQSITALDPDEYEACGYYNVLADADFRILSGTLRTSAPTSAAITVSADTLYDLAEITDGAGRTQTVSISRTTGATVQISPAGSNNLARGVRSDGYAVYKSDRANAAPGSLYARLLTGTSLGAEIPVMPYRKIIAVGDSLTYMGGSDGTNSAYWQLTAALLGAGWTSQGFGISGQTQDQIAARWGVLPIYVTLTANWLPATGSVIITAINQNPISGQIHYAIRGRLGVNGPYVKLQRDGDEGNSSNYIMTQEAGVSAYAIPAGTQFFPEAAYWGSSTAFIPYPYDGIFIAWMGRNNPSNAFSIVDRVQRVLATQKTLTKRFIVPLILPGVGDETGTSTRAVIEASNAAIRSAFPNNWVDFLPALQGGSNGSAQDAADVASGLIPSSLRLKDSDGVTIDFLHPNAAGRAIEAQVLRDFIVAKGWTL